MKRGAWLLPLALTAGCGGPELLVDVTPPVLVPNGGSAQAGQVEGPTAIPISGAGAIVEPEATEPEAVAPPAQPPPTVMDLAALEANGASGATAATALDGEASAPALDDEDDEDEPGEAMDDAAPEEPSPPTTPAAKPAAVAVAPATSRTRAVGGPGYDLRIPADWEDLDPTGLGSVLITSANRSMDPGAGFYTNVIVSAEPFAGDTPSYATLNMPSLLDAGALLRESSTVAPTKRDRGHVDVEAYWINVTGAPYVTLQRYVTTGTVGYVVTCAVAASAIEAERETCARVLDSARFD